MTDAGVAPRNGATRIEERALRNLTAHLAAHDADIAARDVKVTLADEAGALAAIITVPLSIDEKAPVSVREQAGAIRERVGSGLLEQSGRRTARVDVRFSGVHVRKPVRVQ